LTISDAYSRMLLACQGLPRADYAHVRPVFDRVFQEYGLPDAIRTDNGSPFASVGPCGLTPLSVWWVKLGIRLERIQPGHPEQNGRHERFHLTLKQDCCSPPAATFVAQQGRFDAYGPTFNYDRPHQALGLETPASWYRPSQRPYPAVLDDPVYPPQAALRRVRSNGEIKWRGRLVFLSTVLKGEVVGLWETPAGHQVHFGPLTLGQLDPREERLLRPGERLSKAKSVTHVLS
jgi:hypothetical protein